MTFIGYAVFFFLAGFIGYMFHADRRNLIGLLLLIALPVIGVYFFGWWALLTFAVGTFSGSNIYKKSLAAGRIVDPNHTIRLNEVVHVLAKTYSLSLVDLPHEQNNMLNRIIINSINTLNEHEMAVKFLAEFTNIIKTDSKGIAEIEKYIRMSKGAYNRGLARINEPQQELFKVARERFNIEPDDIVAA